MFKKKHKKKKKAIELNNKSSSRGCGSLSELGQLK